MKKIWVMFVTGLLIFVFIGMANAVPLTFDEVPLGTTDPTIEGVSSWAGDPISFFDTYTDDSWTPGNPYLANGIDDGTGMSPGLYGNFIGMSSTFNRGTYFFDIASEGSLPPQTILSAEAYAGAGLVTSDTVTVAFDDYAYHSLSLTSGIMFDKIYIYADAGNFGFHIDNFDCTPAIPEPAAILLICLGLLPIGIISKRRDKN